MNVLILGSGGREHAFAWKIAQSPLLKKLFIAPGNAGTRTCGENISIPINDFITIGKFVIEKDIQLVVVGPEEPLVNGISDYFQKTPELENIMVIGPRKDGAMLEGSKEFAKKFMVRHQIPTARYLAVNRANCESGKQFLKTLSPPYVLKADGLAAGKGVVILSDLKEAAAMLETMLNGKFGSASDIVVIEEFLSGIELSVFVLTDGLSYVLLPEAKDYKRIGEGDSGPNTGGMGAISPVPFANEEFMEKVTARIIKPTIEGLKKENISYQGFIFFGLINVMGDPYVIEYNCRMGDPETEAVLPRIESDFLELLIASGRKRLSEIKIVYSANAVATIMLVSGGYPGDYEKGKAIENIRSVAGSILFHSGTADTGEHVVTNGGRVIAVTSFGKSVDEAISNSVRNAEIISFEGKYYRKDIGFDL